MRLLFVHSRKASFVAIDREILAERYEIEDLYQPGRWPNPLKVIGGVLRADVVFGWFASWHTFFPITLAWLLRKPSVLIIGGFDTRQHARHRLRLPAGRPAALGEPLDHAARRAADHQLELQPQRDRAQHADPGRTGSPSSTTVCPTRSATPRRTRSAWPSPSARSTAARSSRRASCRSSQAARELPDVRFVLAGKWLDDAVEQLREAAPENVEFTGWLSDEDLLALYRRAAVYVQASRHEGFGLAVAEAMLAGCVPVVLNVTAMPEVVGDAGVLIDSQGPEEVADGRAPRAGAGPGGESLLRASVSSRPSRWRVGGTGS